MPFKSLNLHFVRNIKLILEYDGSAFFGFQKQPRHPTIQQALETALSKLFSQKTKIQAASGRTDSGVHAQCQVVNFKIKNRLAVEKIQRGLNALLPHAIAVKAAEEVELDFHARYGARTKVYEYRIWNSPVRSPLNAGRTCHIPYLLNFARLQQGAALLKGRHDFRSFAATDGAKDKPARKSDRKNTVRTIKRFQIKRHGPLIIFRVEADGFLYHMVRNLVGTLIEVGRGKLTLADLRRILLGKDRSLAGPTAPASGLTLVDVTYSLKEG